MPTLEPKIDELYQAPLSEFTAARNALAKTLNGDDARRVKRLEKPTVVPWAINQVYWNARAVYDRLLKSGEALRNAQLAVLKGRKADVRRATEAHHKAVADAVREATRLAASAGSHPGAEPLARMLEAISLSPAHPDQPGRLTDFVQPAGFEALAGMGSMTAPVTRPLEGREEKKPEQLRRTRAERQAEAKRQQEERRAEAERLRAEQRVEAQRQRGIANAEQALERARAAEARARRELDRAQDVVHAARQALEAARKR